MVGGPGENLAQNYSFYFCPKTCSNLFRLLTWWWNDNFFWKNSMGWLRTGPVSRWLFLGCVTGCDWFVTSRSYVGISTKYQICTLHPFDSSLKPSHPMQPIPHIQIWWFTLINAILMEYLVHLSQQACRANQENLGVWGSGDHISCVASRLGSTVLWSYSIQWHTNQLQRYVVYLLFMLFWGFNKCTLAYDEQLTM